MRESSAPKSAALSKYRLVRRRVVVIEPPVLLLHVAPTATTILPVIVPAYSLHRERQRSTPRKPIQSEGPRRDVLSVAAGDRAAQRAPRTRAWHRPTASRSSKVGAWTGMPVPRSRSRKRRPPTVIFFFGLKRPAFLLLIILRIVRRRGAVCPAEDCRRGGGGAASNASTVTKGLCAPIEPAVGVDEGGGLIMMALARRGTQVATRSIILSEGTIHTPSAHTGKAGRVASRHSMVPRSTAPSTCPRARHQPREAAPLTSAGARTTRDVRMAMHRARLQPPPAGSVLAARARAASAGV